MDDHALIRALVEREGSRINAAKFLGVTVMALHKWRTGRLPHWAHLMAWLALHHPRLFARWREEWQREGGRDGGPQ